VSPGEGIWAGTNYLWSSYESKSQTMPWHQMSLH